MKKLWLFGMIICFGLSVGPAQASLVDGLAKNAEISDAKISPTGEYLAVLKEEDGKRKIFVFEFPAMKLINIIDAPGRSEVGTYRWVNDERLLLSISVDWGNREDDIGYGELYAVNADGKKGKYLFGVRGDQNADIKSRTSKVKQEFASAQYIRNLPNPRKVAIQIFDWTRGYNSVVTGAVLDVYSGRISNKVRPPHANSNLLVDRFGEFRFANYLDDDQVSIISERDPKTGKWSEFSRAPYGESIIEPVAIADDGRFLVYKAHQDGPRGLYYMEPKAQTFEKIYQHDLVDIKDVLLDEKYEPYGFVLIPDFIEIVALKPDHPDMQLLQSLRQAFPDGVPLISNTTKDQRLSIVAVRSDVRTREYFLFDRKSNQLTPLFDTRPWIDDELLSPMQPITVEARDGLQMHGYLTIPRGAEPKNLPLVIVPHGGPHGPRDEWGLGWEHFIPASGYAMLQINYRGSGGYGMAYESSGFKKWATTMQDDLTDAVKWAIDQGIADPDRICISGWSYGGYATVMSIAREPDLYKCAVAGAGVYNQKIQYRKADFASRTRWGKKYMQKAIGETDEELMAASPVSYIDQIKTPLLLVHGEDDERVPVEHAYDLVKAMKKAGKPEPKLIILKNEPHGPRNVDNVKLWYHSTIEFIEKHIGPGVKPVKGAKIAQN